MEHFLAELPYPMDSLSPYISRETLEYHHGKHHKTYVDNLNRLITKTEFSEMSLEKIIKEASGGVFNNAAQVWNHSFYWKCMSPKVSSMPARELSDAINLSFGSFQNFKDSFTNYALTLFGSGWVWLTKDGEGKLEILAMGNAGNPIKEGKRPLLCCDVWEHAYYIDYRNSRPKYLEAFWNLVDWEFVSKNFSE
jgi:Fe-Mn family superoxide dismutase